MSREWIIDKEAVEALSATITEAPRKSHPARPPHGDLAKLANIQTRVPRLAPVVANEKADSPSFLSRAVRWAMGAAAVALALYAVQQAAFEPETPAPSPRGLAAAANPAPAQASSGSQESFSLTPGLVIARVAPGQSFSQTLTLSNSTPYELTFELNASDLVAKNGEAAISPAGALPRSLAATAYFSQRVVNVKPQQSRTVEVTFTVPEGTSAQGLVVEFRGMDRVPLNPALGMTPSVGSLIAIATDPASDTPAEIESGRTAPAFNVSQWSNPTSSSGERPAISTRPGEGPAGAAPESSWPSEGQ
jgi:hypothetical protein